MELPFTSDQFVRVFIDYNRSIWPIQPLAWVLGAVTVWIAYIDRAWSSRFVLAALALMSGIALRRYGANDQ